MCVLVSYLEVYTQSCKVPKFLVLPNCSGLNRENGEKYRFKAKVGKSMRNNRDAPGPEQPSRYPPSTYKSARIYIMTFWNTDFIPAGQTGPDLGFAGMVPDLNRALGARLELCLGAFYLVYHN